MKQFIILLSFIGFVFAVPPPECLEGPKTSKTSDECCKVTVIPQNIINQCKAANPRPPPGPPTGCCMSECVLNTTKILNNGVYDKNAAVTYITQQMGGDDESKKIATAAIDFCAGKADGLQADFDNSAKMTPPGSQVCNMRSGFMMGCVAGQVIKNCPAAKYTADAECDKVKAFIDKCMIILPPHA